MTLREVLVLVVVALALFVLHWVLQKKTSPSAVPTTHAPFDPLSPSGLPLGVTAVLARAPLLGVGHVINEFYSSFSMSTDPSQPGPGLDIEGRYVENGKVVKASTSLSTAADLSRFPLTYAAGHDYYSLGGAQSWGRLRGGDWKAFVRAVARPVPLKALLPGAVLLVEGVQDGTGEPSCVSVSGSFEALGIVVRRGGVLLIDDAPAQITTSFILVESGGLLQAGANAQGGAYRFQSQLNISLVHPPAGYSSMGVVPSQYSYKVYAPGVTDVTRSASRSSREAAWPLTIALAQRPFASASMATTSSMVP